MKEFLPWSAKTYNKAIEKYRNGYTSVLDVQLSGICNYNCVYCDSPNRTLQCEIDFEHLFNLLDTEKEKYDWLFVCGLGEPLWAENKKTLLTLLNMCEKMNVKCTIFTNGSQIDECILEYIRKGILYPIIKIDTFSYEESVQLYGTSRANETLDAIRCLFEIGKKSTGNYCNIAASIVPTAKNKKELINIVKQCLDHNVFPLIGQLEYAGQAIDNYTSLLLTKAELMEIKKQIGDYIHEEYNVPICPSVIAGIHITNDGWVSVDRRSGLSCSWFWLETPQTQKLCKVNELMSLGEADSAIINYRNSVYREMEKLVSQIEEHPFGGCGGNIKALAEEYIKLQKAFLVDKGIVI